MQTSILPIDSFRNILPQIRKIDEKKEHDACLSNYILLEIFSLTDPYTRISSLPLVSYQFYSWSCSDPLKSKCYLLHRLISQVKYIVENKKMTFLTLDFKEGKILSLYKINIPSSCSINRKNKYKSTFQEHLNLIQQNGDRYTVSNLYENFYNCNPDSRDSYKIKIYEVLDDTIIQKKSPCKTKEVFISFLCSLDENSLGKIVNLIYEGFTEDQINDLQKNEKELKNTYYLWNFIQNCLNLPDEDFLQHLKEKIKEYAKKSIQGIYQKSLFFLYDNNNLEQLCPNPELAEEHQWFAEELIHRITKL
jgi:hypothetical protein